MKFTVQATALVVFLLTFFPSQGFSIDPPEFVKDINQQPLGGSPYGMVDVGGTAFFVQSDQAHGAELWKSDGTSVGTVMVKDINPGPSGSWPSQLVNAGGTLFFYAGDGTNGFELWKSDGTEGGTIMVKDIRSGADGSAIRELTNIGGTLYFRADDGSGYGSELWKSNGTESGTFMVKDVYPDSNGSSPGEFTDVGGIVFFRAYTTGSNWEIFKSDGTEGNTVQVTSTSSYHNPQDLTALGSNLYYQSDADGYGYELWMTNGNYNAESIVQDICSSCNSFPTDLQVMGSWLYFSAHDGTNFTDVSGTELWRTNGTTTERVADVVAGTNSCNPREMTVVGGELYFTCLYLKTLYKTDGADVSPATTLVADLSGGSNYLNTFTESGGILYFLNDDGTHGTEAWKHDPAGPTTEIVEDIYPETMSSSPGSLADVGGTLFFSADDGTNGTELWKSTDGTAANTSQVYTSTAATAGSSIDKMASVNRQLFFQANDGTLGVELWKSDGTVAGTDIVKDINPSGSSNPTEIVDLKGTALFRADDGSHGYELWKSDGTEVGTAIVKDINSSGIEGSYPEFLTPFGNAVYFSAKGAENWELWKSNGTASGTTIVKNINTNTGCDPYIDCGSSPENLTVSGSSLFFSAYDGSNGTELWKSNGSSSGTLMVENIYPGSSGSYPEKLTDVNGTLFFTADDGTNGRELWKSNGSGASLVKDICDSGDGVPLEEEYRDVANVNGTFFFVGYDDDHDKELWKSNGTESGTTMVKDIWPGDDYSDINNMTPVKSTLFFTADDSIHGYELWKSDGTEGGTTMVKDILPGSGDSYPYGLTNVRGTLYFGVNNFTNGVELWKSDGTEAGTVMVMDIWPGTDSGYPGLLGTKPNDDPSIFVLTGKQLFFTAQEGMHGRELWVINNIPSEFNWNPFLPAIINSKKKK